MNAVDLQGMTPLRIALRTCQFEIAEFLYHKDAKLAVTEGITNTSTLLVCHIPLLISSSECCSFSHTCAHTPQYAGSHGPIKELSLETASDYEKHLSKCALHAWIDDYKLKSFPSFFWLKGLVDKIIQKGVDINEKDGLGNTILHYAVYVSSSFSSCVSLKPFAH